MKKPAGILKMILLLTVLSGMMSCTTNPTAGTETGNPDITASLAAALHTFDTLDQWLPSKYLVGGETLLNPARINDELSHAGVAKTAAIADTAPVEPVIVRKDTILIIDTQFVNDTVIVDTLVSSTFNRVSDDGTGSTKLDAQYIRHDTVIVRDTVFKVDTIIAVTLDTSGQETSAIDNSSTIQEYFYISSDSMTTYVLKRNGETWTVVENQTEGPVSAGTTTPSETILPEIRSGITYLSVAKVSNLAGTTISEYYSYPAVSTATDSYLSADNALFASHGIISFTTGASTTVLDIDFDAGNDRDFSTASDNRISALLRKTVENATVTDRVSYGARYFGALTDTLVLQREQVFGTGSVSRQVAHYRCLKGVPDSADHRYNRMTSCTRQIWFRDERNTVLSFTVNVPQPLIAGETPVSAQVTGTVDFGKGLTGLIDAVADFSVKRMYGTYAQAGVEYRFTYSLTDSCAQLVKIE